MSILPPLFWFSLVILIYTYIGYPILLYFLVFMKKSLEHKGKPGRPDPGTEPNVTLVIAAYNEGPFIEEKIRNCFELEYPKDRIKVLFVTDGSTDQSTETIGKYPAIRLFHKEQRNGKLAALNRAMAEVDTPIVIFSDANSLLNKRAVHEIIKHFADPRVGGVAGEKRILSAQADDGAGAGEGMYWRYESLLKKLDSELYTVVGAAGELFSIRKELYEYLDEDIILEDFVQSLTICLKGYTVRYEPGAIAFEPPSISMKEEEKRRIRISAGAFQALGRLRSIFNIFKYPLLSFQFISHRALRWTICPISLPLLFVSNLMLVASGTGSWYVLVMGFQFAFYGSAVLGYLLALKNMKINFLYAIYYFLFMNISVWAGFIRFLINKQSVLWEKAERQRLQ